jgi:hypothetical protein
VIEKSPLQDAPSKGFLRTEAREALLSYFLPLTALVRLALVLLSGASRVEIRPGDRP